ncbi:DUF2804 domain-containing protein [Marinobacter sp. JSM 1782161]|uniref:DUF2804 domain-containing protein n=1 Tax=Marinobacter sp. JSM 1782161 TaxID=2685906 RepID=UPI0014024769|nr:DUF2804 domain-containing protein [Marinobacter sp. JSM 1782161]
MDLINARGQPLWGELDQPVERINYLDHDLRSVMDRPLSRRARQRRYNHFQFISVQGPEWVLGLALVDLGRVANAFCYLYDFGSRELVERSWLNPLGWGSACEPSPETGCDRFVRPGVRLTIQGEGRRRHLRGMTGDMHLDFTLSGDNAPLRVCSRAGYDGWVFTRKSAGLAVSGSVQWGRRRYQTDASMRGSIDWSGGFMRRDTAWNWACIAGRTADGRSLGLNLAAGVNETGVTENALWLDGERIKLDLARFEFDRYQPEAAWRVSTSDGRVDLVFRPQGVRRERINAFWLASNFRQYVGHFEGTVRDPADRPVEVSGLPGLVEDHYARW